MQGAKLSTGSFLADDLVTCACHVYIRRLVGDDIVYWAFKGTQGSGMISSATLVF